MSEEESSPPARRLPPRQRAQRPLAKKAARAALRTAYRVVQPEGGAFEERFKRPPLAQVHYQAEDGWTGALFKLPLIPGASGEPVVLIHGLGCNRVSMDYSPDRSLAVALQASGFQVYLMEHRGDRSAWMRSDEAGAAGFDEIAAFDLPAAQAAALADSGFAALHWVGHGMGGQLLIAGLGRCGGEGSASVSLLCAPVVFPRSRRAGLQRWMVQEMEPFQLPLRMAGQIFAPGLRSGGEQGALRGAPARVRGLMMHGSEDLHSLILQQLLRWAEEGRFCDRAGRIDYLSALSDLRVPVHLTCSAGDELCPPAAALPALDCFTGPRAILELGEEWGHLDPLLGERAPELVYPAIAAWLEEHRERSWG